MVIDAAARRLAEGQKLPDDVLKLLKIHEGHMIDKLEALEQLVTGYNAKNSHDTVLLDLSTSELGGKLASMLVKEANSDALTSAKALEVEDLLLIRWKNLNLSPVDVMDRLQLTKTEEDFTSPNLATFMKCITRSDAEDVMRERSLLQISTDRCGDRAVAVALVRARDDVF